MNRRDSRCFRNRYYLGGLHLPLAKSEEKRMLPIVDTHQHLWNLDEFKLAWFDPKTPEGKPSATTSPRKNTPKPPRS